MEVAVSVEVVEVAREGEEGSTVEEEAADEDLVGEGVLAEVEGLREVAAVVSGEVEGGIEMNSARLQVASKAYGSSWIRRSNGLKI